MEEITKNEAKFLLEYLTEYDDELKNKLNLLFKKELLLYWKILSKMEKEQKLNRIELLKKVLNDSSQK